MLNIACIFEDANRTTPHFDCLKVAPLPAAVYMMQVDVINHYRYALDHYFALTLNEPYLQNSSIGTPYQKWAFFTNKNFDVLAFAIQNLMRYTSRLIYESECIALKNAQQFSKMKNRGNTYIGPLAELRHGEKSIGIRINDDNSLRISALRTEPITEHVILRACTGGPTGAFVITTDAEGREHEQPISQEEYRRISEHIRSQTVVISDRSILTTLRDRGHAEIAELVRLNRIFADAASTFCRSRDMADPFGNYIPEWCI